MKKILLIIVMFFGILSYSQTPGGGDCATAAPFCTDYQYDFPCQTNTTAETGPDYDCLWSQPNPAWYFFEISTAGNIDMSLSAPSDIDFIIWGPFQNMTCNYSDLSSGNVVDCSFSSTNNETPSITNAQVGDVYVMLITNYSGNVQDFSLSQTGGNGATDCSIVNPQCSVDAGPDQEICLGDFTNITATSTILNSAGVQSFIWSPNGTYINDSTTNVQANLATQTYTVSLTTVDGCTASDEMIITTIDLTLDQIIVTNENCGQSDGTATITMSNGLAPFTYDIGITTNTTGIFTDLPANTYQITITDANGCTETSQFTIIDDGSINVDYHATDWDMCWCDNSFNFINDGFSDPNATYEWNFGGSDTIDGIAGNTSTLENPINIHYPHDGTYDVQLTTTFGTCSDSITQQVTVFGSVNFDIITTDNSCYQSCDGTANINIISGTQPFNYVWSNGETTPIASNLCSGTIALNIVDDNGCIHSDIVLVNEPTELTLNLTTTSNISCFGLNDGSIEILAQGGTPPYNYDIGNGYQTSNIFNNLNAGTYNINVTDNNGCSTNIIVTLTEPNELLLTNTFTDILCNGDSTGSYSLNIIGGTPPYTTIENGDTILLTYNDSLQGGIYSIDVIDNNGCSVNNIITITEPTQLISSIPPVYNICNGEVVNLSTSTSGGVSPYTYTWNNSSEISDNINVQPSDTTHYSYIVTDANGCNYGPIQTVVNPTMPIIFNVFAQDSAVCPGEPTTLTYTIENGISPYTVTLNGNIVINPITVYPHTLNNNFPLIVTDACGQQVENNISVSTYYVPVVSFQSNILNGCEPLSVDFIELINNDNYFYHWNYGDNSDGYSQNTTHIYKNDGVYNVTLEVTTDNGCLTSKTITNMINVFPLPEAKFYTDPITTTILDPTVSIINLSEGGYYYIWDFGDNDSSNIENPYHTYEKPDIYKIKLIVRTIYGCIDSATFNYTVEDITTFYAPTAFSPDGDNINDGFKVFGYNIDRDNFNLKVFDRWGEVIWETNNYDEYWNGHAKSNKIVSNDSYLWYCSWMDFNGNHHEKSGYVTVIR